VEELGDATDMVGMGVGDKEYVNVSRIIRKRLTIRFWCKLTALEESTINENLAPFSFKKKIGTRNAPDTAMKRDF
jgi:hypothetical protein